MNAHIGRPVADLDDFLEPEPTAPQLRVAAAEAPPARPDRRRARIWIMACTALVIAAALAAWLLLSSGSPVAAASSAEPTRSETGIAGFAEMFVAEFLSGESDAVAEFLPAAPPLSAMAPAAHYAARTAAIEIDYTGPGYWSVVVAADVLTLDGAGYVPAGLQHFQVGVVDDGGRLVAAGLPSRVAAPPPRRAAPRQLAIADVAPSDAVTALAGDFLEALLLGDRDISRYVSVGSQISPVAPTYAGLAITSLSSYADGTVRAIVDATSPRGLAVTMEYVLRIDQATGEPLVAAILPGPPSIHDEGAAR